MSTQSPPFGLAICTAKWPNLTSARLNRKSHIFFRACTAKWSNQISKKIARPNRKVVKSHLCFDPLPPIRLGRRKSGHFRGRAQVGGVPLIKRPHGRGEQLRVGSEEARNLSRFLIQDWFKVGSCFVAMERWVEAFRAVLRGLAWARVLRKPFF